jgi:putative inorganic carbon (HCO3(-)) transporter
LPIRGIVLLAAFLISVPISFVKPFYGVLVWTVVAIVNPQSALFYWRPALLFPWAEVAAVPTILGFLVFGRGWSNLISRETILLFLLWIWFTVTTIISTHTSLFQPHAADTWYRWQFVSKVLLMTLITIGVVDSFARLRILLLVIAGSFGVFIVKALPFMIMTGGQYRLYGPENSMIADNNDFGLALNMTLPVFFFLAQTESKQWVRYLCGFMFLITIPAVFFTYSRGALLGMLVILFLMFLRLKQRLLLIPVILVGLLVAVAFAPEAWKQRMDPSAVVDASALSRFNAWTYCWNLSKDYPLTGAGFDAFTPELFHRYAPNAIDIHGPHSIYFGVLAEHGYIGLGGYLALVLSFFATTYRLVKTASYYGDMEIVSYANMFRFSVVGFLTSGIFLGRAYFDYFFTIIACAVILQHVAEFHWSRMSEIDMEAEEQPA